MSESRSHKPTLGPTARMLDGCRRRITYRTRKVGDEDWQVRQVEMVLPTTHDDLEGYAASVHRLRFIRERHLDIEVEVIANDYLGTERPVTTTKDQRTATVDEKTYKELEAKSSLIYPGHPAWEERFN